MKKMRLKTIFVFLCLISCGFAYNADMYNTLAQPTYGKPKTVSYTLTLKKVTLTSAESPDGVERPGAITINGKYPAPILTCNKGDTFCITVINNLDNGTGVHWHGIDQVGTPWFDGAPGVTQCLIEIGNQFTYTFSPNQSGTYWYHSHYDRQIVDGMRGSMVIHDPDDPNESSYDEQYVMTVGDWYNTPGEQIVIPRGDPVADAGEISGVGQYGCTIPNCPKNTSYSIYKIEKSKRYRFRIINYSTMSQFRVSFDNHPMTIIECDGTPIQPYTLEVLPINIGQRYSAIITANQAAGSYWIRASFTNCTSSYKTIGGILCYDGESTSTLPTSEPYYTNLTNPDCSDVNSTCLKPHSLSPSVPQDKTVNKISIKVNITSTGATMNNSTFIPNFTDPSIFKVKNNGDFVTSDNIYEYDDDKPVEICAVNCMRAYHAFHMHGHSFWIVAQGTANSDCTVDTNSIVYNFDNPPFRDTVTLSPNGYVVIRYFPDNPGVWLFHCHIHWHFEMGMVAQLNEAPKKFQALTIPQNVQGLCGKNVAQ